MDFVQFDPVNLRYSASPKFDWDSTMLYPSTAGAKEELLKKRNVLMKDYSVRKIEIKPNIHPSEEDFVRLRGIYPRLTLNVPP